jgi:hypothetical protein
MALDLKEDEPPPRRDRRCPTCPWSAILLIRRKDTLEAPAQPAKQIRRIE